MSRRSNNTHILFHKKILAWSCKYNITTLIVKKWRACMYTLIWCCGICNTDTRGKIIHEFMWVISLLIRMFYNCSSLFQRQERMVFICWWQWWWNCGPWARVYIPNKFLLPSLTREGNGVKEGYNCSFFISLCGHYCCLSITFNYVSWVLARTM